MDDVVKLFSFHKFLSDDDSQVITYAPSEYLKFQILLESLKHLKLSVWTKICHLLLNTKSLEHVGIELMKGNLYYICTSIPLKLYFKAFYLT